MLYVTILLAPPPPSMTHVVWKVYVALSILGVNTHIKGQRLIPRPAGFIISLLHTAVGKVNRSQRAISCPPLECTLCHTEITISWMRFDDHPSQIARLQKVPGCEHHVILRRQAVGGKSYNLLSSIILTGQSLSNSDTMTIKRAGCLV